MLKIGTVKWQGKCGRHPNFDPNTDGPGAIKGGCPRCADLMEIFESYQRTLRLMRAFGPNTGQRRNLALERERERQQNLFTLPI